MSSIPNILLVQNKYINLISKANVNKLELFTYLAFASLLLHPLALL